MGSGKINVRNYRHQKKYTVAAAILCWFIMAVNLFVVLKPYFVLPLIQTPDSDWGSKSIYPMIFNYSNMRTDAYEVEGDVRIHGTSSTIFIVSTDLRRNIYIPQTIKPHPRKYDASAMARVKGFKIKVGPVHKTPRCTRNLDAPAVLFSTGGHVGNHFHRVTDVLVPLFATSHRFHRRVHLLVSNRDPRVTSNYREILDGMSEYEIRDIDGEDEILCFPKMMIGLKARMLGLSIDPTQSSSSRLSMPDFMKFVRSVYSLQRATVRGERRRRPRMLLVMRSTSRRLRNAAEVVEMASRLGFEAVAEEFGANATAVAGTVNAADVMVGVHGAGLTNMIFLPENAVVIQITPVGVEYFAKMCFGEAQMEEMKLKYLEYRVGVNESSLKGRYPADSEVYKDTGRLCLLRGFDDCKKLYMDHQDITLHLPTFKITLLKALEFLAVLPSSSSSL